MNEPPDNQAKYPQWKAYLLATVILVLVYMTLQHLMPPEPGYDIPYSQFKALVRSG